MGNLISRSGNLLTSHQVTNSAQKYETLSRSPEGTDTDIEYETGRSQLHNPSSWRNRAGILVHYIIAWSVILIIAGGYKIVKSQISTKKIGPLATDGAFGPVPMRRVVWEQDDDFVNSDPFDGTFWGAGGLGNVWDTIDPGSWIQVQTSAKYGVFGGLPLDQYSDSWTEKSQAFVPSMLHQIHCVGNLKHMFLRLKRNEILSLKDHGHADHCLEYLRQAVMCHGDLTLEKPLTNDSHIKSQPWGVEHHCRDWDALWPAIRQRGLVFDTSGDWPVVSPLLD